MGGQFDFADTAQQYNVVFATNVKSPWPLTPASRQSASSSPGETCWIPLQANYKEPYVLIKEELDGFLRTAVRP